MRRTKKIGCLGFSANPPHNGHLAAARLLLRKKLVDEVWLIPCFAHSFGKKLAPVKHRWRMAQLLLSPTSCRSGLKNSRICVNSLDGYRAKIKISDIEIRRRGKSYTIDTIRELRAAYPHYDFFWILGADQIAKKEYMRWKGWRGACKRMRFFVVPRSGYTVKKAPPCCILLGGRGNKISSTEIRERIRRGLSVKRFVPPSIERYIKKHGLYQH